MIDMNWYKIAIGKEYPSEMQRRMPETDQQIYDYFHSDDPPFMKEDYFDYKMRDIDMTKPPDEMSYQEKGRIMHPEEGDIGKSDYKIDEIIDSIIDREGKISKKLIDKYLLEFLSTNLSFRYIGNYIKKNYELV